MLVGAFHFPTDYGIEISELARALEERGFESLFVCEHTHIPVSRRTPFPAGGDLPKRYKHTHDPFVALSFAAAATSPRRLLIRGAGHRSNLDQPAAFTAAVRAFARDVGASET